VPDEHDARLIAELFSTPLCGAYVWDYETADPRMHRLYALGKERNWNAALDIDWSVPFDRSKPPIVAEVASPFQGWEPFEALSPEARVEFEWHHQAWVFSQFLHGEQGGLLVASQLVSCAPTYDAKLYAASQTFDEARHVEVFSRYLRERVGLVYPVNRHLKALLDKILSDPRWDLKLIGIQLIVESLALAAFQAQRDVVADQVMREILDRVVRDESRHVAFGLEFMREHVMQLSEEEIEERAQFAYEACAVMRERIVSTDVFEHYGWDVEEGRRRYLSGPTVQRFQKYLFARTIPGLKRVGLLTPRVRDKYRSLGVLDYEAIEDLEAIDWAALEAPLSRTGATARDKG
jgi:hypothetical protein